MELNAVVAFKTRPKRRKGSSVNLRADDFTSERLPVNFTDETTAEELITEVYHSVVDNGFVTEAPVDELRLFAIVDGKKHDTPLSGVLLTALKALGALEGETLLLSLEKRHEFGDTSPSVALRIPDQGEEGVVRGLSFVASPASSPRSDYGVRKQDYIDASELTDVWVRKLKDARKALAGRKHWVRRLSQGPTEGGLIRLRKTEEKELSNYIDILERTVVKNTLEGDIMCTQFDKVSQRSEVLREGVHQGQYFSEKRESLQRKLESLKATIETSEQRERKLLHEIHEQQQHLRCELRRASSREASEAPIAALSPNPRTVTSYSPTSISSIWLSKEQKSLEERASPKPVVSHSPVDFLSPSLRQQVDAILSSDASPGLSPRDIPATLVTSGSTSGALKALASDLSAFFETDGSDLDTRRSLLRKVQRARAQLEGDMTTNSH